MISANYFPLRLFPDTAAYTSRSPRPLQECVLCPGFQTAEYSGSGTLLRRYVYGVRLDEPLVQITTAGTKFYYRADGLGSVIAHEEWPEIAAV